MVRCACRAERLDCVFRGMPPAEAGAPPATALSGRTEAAALLGVVRTEAAALLGVVEPSAFPAPLRNVRAADDGELGGGSGISHANAAGETAGGSVPDGAAPDGTAPDGKVGDEPAVDGVREDSAVPPRVQSSVADETEADAGRLVANGGESPREWSPASVSGASGFGTRPGSLCRVPRDDPILSAGKAGGPPAAASVTALLGVSFAAVSAGPPLAETSIAASITVPLAGVPLAAGPPPAAWSGTVPSGCSVVAGAGLGVPGLRGTRLGGAAMMPLGRVSWSSPMGSSSPASLEVTIVGEAPPEPSGPFVRLSKPSSL
jgi:hypothetical protein